MKYFFKYLPYHIKSLPRTIKRNLPWVVIKRQNEWIMTQANEIASLNHKLLTVPNSPVLVERLEASLRMAEQRGFYPEQNKDIWNKATEAAENRIFYWLETLRCPANGIEHDCTDDLAGYSVDDLIELFKRENTDNSVIRTTSNNVITDTESKSVTRRKQIENGENLID